MLGSSLKRQASVSTAIDSPKSETDEYTAGALSSPLPREGNASKKRSLPKYRSQEAGTLAGIFSPSRLLPDDNHQHQHQHHDLFAAILEDSRMSDGFLGWQAGGTFVDDGDNSSRDKLEAPWEDPPQWSASDSPFANMHAKRQIDQHSENIGGLFASPIKRKASLTESTPRTPNHGMFLGISIRSDASTQNKGLSSQKMSVTYSNPQSLSSGEKVFPDMQLNTLLLPASSPFSEYAQAAASPSRTSPNRSPTLDEVRDSLSLYSPSSSSLEDSSSEVEGFNNVISPRKLYDASPPSQSSSMRVTLGRSTQSLFEGINSKLKEKQYMASDSSKKLSSLAPAGPRDAQVSRKIAYHQRQPPVHFGTPHQRPPHATHPVEFPHGGIRAEANSSHSQRPSIAQPAVALRKSSTRSKAARAAASLTTKSLATTPGQPTTSIVSVEKGEKESELPKSGRVTQVTCNCKKSRCLKLYCDCFSQKQFCDGCKCDDCRNTLSCQSERDEAVKEILSKNAHAFQPRISTKSHSMGCRCKKSACLKKYCECFEARVLCSEKCKCKGCLNQAGSQLLIDKRHKMKDTIGARFAMQESEKKWKSQGPRRLATVRDLPSALPSPALQSHPSFPPMQLVDGPRGPMPIHHPYPQQYMPHRVPHGYIPPVHMYIPYGAPQSLNMQTPYAAHLSAAPPATAVSWRYHRESPPLPTVPSVASPSLAPARPGSSPSSSN